LSVPADGGRDRSRSLVETLKRLTGLSARIAEMRLRVAAAGLGSAQGVDRVMTTEIIIVDDQELVRLGYRMVINSQSDLKVIGEAGDGAQAITAARVLRPDVVLMDIRMPYLDGVLAARQIVREEPGARIILVTTFDLDEYIEAGLRAGVRGFLLKDATPARLLAAIRAVKAGELVLPSAAVEASGSSSASAL
jgi:DNA-binding NarL/FixJ family response regulator